MSEALVWTCWLIVGTVTAAASIIVYIAQLPDPPDKVDALFLSCIGVLIALVGWPFVLIAVPVYHLGRRLHAVSHPEAND